MSTIPELTVTAAPSPVFKEPIRPVFGAPEAVDARFKLRYFLCAELKSLLGRLVSRQVVPAHPHLHVGCGPRIAKGFENLDFYTLSPQALRLPIRRHDLRYPLPYPDASFKGAFTEHVMEHLFSHEVVAVMSEFRRVLKPGGVLRVTVPDLGKYIRFYSGASSPGEFQRHYRSGCEALWALTQCWGHVSCWDAETMIRVLQQVGFTSVTEVSFGKGANPDLIIDDPEKAWETLYVEAIK